jgi:tetratricopeptide (TPR) repeat protein
VSFDRAKALESAQKYLAKGQLDRAIAEYERLVQADPKDSRLLLKLGDLYTRQGATRDASATYRRVADQYAEQGFFLKAVAVCKQVLKLDPTQIDVWERLGEMYEMLSLVSDAITTYEQVAEASTRNNNPRKALKAMQKLAELDPGNVAARIRYAEALSKLNRPEEAAVAFREGSELLKQQGRIEDYLKVGERLLFHQPDNHGFARELATTYLDRNDAKHALVKLQACFNADPKNLDTLQLLARAFEQLGQTAKTVSVLKEVARLHAVEARSAEQGSVLKRILALDPRDAEARRDLSQLKRLPTQNHEPSSAAIDVSDEDYDLLLEDDESNLVEETQVTGQHETLDAQAQAKVARLLDECAVFIRYGLTEKMITQLQEVLSIDARHVDAREKLKDAFIKARKPADAIQQLLTLSEQVKIEDPERAKAYLTEALRIDPSHDQAKRSFNALLLGHANQPVRGRGRGLDTRARDTHEATTAAIPRTAFEERPEESFASVIPDADVDASADQVEMIVDDAESGDDSAYQSHEEPHEEPAALVADTALDDDDVVFVDETTDASIVAPLAHEPEASYEEHAADAAIEYSAQHEAHEYEAEYEAEAEIISAEPSYELEHESVVPAALSEPAPATLPPPPRLPSISHLPPAQPALVRGEEAPLPEGLRDVLEEIEFYLSQEMNEEAQSTLNDALASFPEHPVLLAKLRELTGAAGDVDSIPPPPPPLPPPPSLPTPPTRSLRPPPVGLPLDAGAARSLLPRPQRIPSLQPPAAADIPRPLGRVSVQPQALAAKPVIREDRSFELAQKLAEEIVPVAPVNHSNAALDVADVLAQFKQGVARQVDKGDTATHYDLGIAYMEMGLHGEAIDEFKLCLADEARRCTAHTMIGLSYVAKGDMDVSVEHLKLALLEKPRPEEELSLWFELGNAFELMGKNLDALDWYEKAAARDANFRDVSQRVARLSSARTPEQEADEFDEMFDNMILKE